MVKTSSSNAEGAGSIPGQGAKIPYASRPKNQNIKQKQYCNKFNKHFKNGLHQKIFKNKKSPPSSWHLMGQAISIASGARCGVDTPEMLTDPDEGSSPFEQLWIS